MKDHVDQSKDKFVIRLETQMFWSQVREDICDFMNYPFHVLFFRIGLILVSFIQPKWYFFSSQFRSFSWRKLAV